MINSQEVSQKFPTPVALRDSDAAEELQASSCHGAPALRKHIGARQKLVRNCVTFWESIAVL